MKDNNKNNAGDPEKRFFSKSILKPNGRKTVMPTASKSNENFRCFPWEVLIKSFVRIIFWRWTWISYYEMSHPRVWGLKNHLRVLFLILTVIIVCLLCHLHQSVVFIKKLWRLLFDIWNRTLTLRLYKRKSFYVILKNVVLFSYFDLCLLYTSSIRWPHKFFVLL